MKARLIATGNLRCMTTLDRYRARLAHGDNLERTSFFSDAVFAIAMTLLAIELRAPTHELVERVGAGQAWAQMIPLFIAYVISFLVLGLYWAGHMRAWKYVTHVGPKLVWLNILQLMFVALMPFATREYSLSYVTQDSLRCAIYAGVLAMISFFSLRTRLAVVKQEHLRDKIGVLGVRWFLWRGAVPLIVFAAMVPLAFVLPVWSIGLTFFLILPLLAVIRRRIFRNPNP